MDSSLKKNFIKIFGVFVLLSGSWIFLTAPFPSKNPLSPWESQAIFGGSLTGINGVVLVTGLIFILIISFLMVQNEDKIKSMVNLND